MTSATEGGGGVWPLLTFAENEGKIWQMLTKKIWQMLTRGVGSRSGKSCWRHIWKLPYVSPLDLTQITVIYCVCAPIESLWVELVSRVRTVASSRTFRLPGFSVVELSFRTESVFRVFFFLISKNNIRLENNFRVLNFGLKLILGFLIFGSNFRQNASTHLWNQ